MPYLSLEVHRYHLVTEAQTQEDASLMGVKKEHVGQQVCALGMEADKDAKSLDATKVQKAEQRTAKHTEVGNGVSTSDAPKVLRERRTTALLTVVEDVVDFQKGAQKQHVGNRAFA